MWQFTRQNQTSILSCWLNCTRYSQFEGYLVYINFISAYLSVWTFKYEGIILFKVWNKPAKKGAIEHTVLLIFLFTGNICLSWPLKSVLLFVKCKIYIENDMFYRRLTLNESSFCKRVGWYLSVCVGFHSIHVPRANLRKQQLFRVLWQEKCRNLSANHV